MQGFRNKSQRMTLRLAAVALLLNALIPAGFMVHPVGEAGMTVVLCPGQGAIPGFPEDVHHPAKPDQGTAADAQAGNEGTCLFAVATGPLLSVSKLAVQPPDYFSPLSLTQSSLIGRPLPRSLLTVRGPPAIS